MAAADREQTNQPGATRLGLLDVLTAIVILAVLLYAAWKQFPVFNQRTLTPSPQVAVTPAAQ